VPPAGPIRAWKIGPEPIGFISRDREARMKKQVLKLLIASAAALAGACAQAGEPSRLFAQELGEVSKELSVDLDYSSSSTGLAASLRLPAFGGEVLVNTKNDLDLARSGFGAPNAGYKRVIAPHIAVYGILSYEKLDAPGPGANPPSSTNFAFGLAYTLRRFNWVLNINPEFVTDDANTNGRGDKTTLFVKAGVGYILRNERYGRTTLIAEVIGENNDNLDTTLNFGLRWEPRRNITLDAVVLNDRGNRGGSSTRIPGMLRLNIAF
jgi:hypothetical protein